MTASITVRQGAAGNPVHAKTAVHIDVEGDISTTPLVDPSLSGDSDPATTDQLTYHLLVDAPAGVDDAVSPSFQPSSDFKWEWDGYVFPAAGSYSIQLIEEVGDTAVITQAVTVA
jgi:hypothetical protein